MDRPTTPLINTFWDDFKAQARWILSTRINRLKQSSNLILQLTSDKLQELETAYNSNPTPENLDRVKLQSRMVTQLCTEKAKQSIFFCKQRIYEQGERVGRLLAYLAHLDDRPPVVVSLKDSEGHSITDPSQVASQFLHFYKNLYKSLSTHTQRELQTYLNTIQFPRLKPEQVKLLDAPITTQDITDVIAQLAKSKAPELDGLPLEFYATYS